MVLRPHQLISALLVTCVLSATGCTKSEDSINKVRTPETVPPDDRADSDSNSTQVEDQDVGELAVGDKAPDFEVEVMGGELLRFSSYLSDASGPTVLLFDRAHW